MQATLSQHEQRSTTTSPKLECSLGHALAIGVVQTPHAIYIASDCYHCRTIVEPLSPAFPTLDAAFAAYRSSPLRKLLNCRTTIGRSTRTSVVFLSSTFTFRPRYAFRDSAHLAFLVLEHRRPLLSVIRKRSFLMTDNIRNENQRISF